MIESVPQIVLAGPLYLHRRSAGFPREQRRLDGEVALGLASAPAAEQRRVQDDLSRRDAEALADRRFWSRGLNISAAPDGSVARVFTSS